ncbi:flagellar export chaperone FliS [Paenibacillus albus]|uniref:Flagellar secretion chaperone FliS n=1 Tax=Paenibacillus albus TaxID=2495582 RepID=A0A3S8ZYD9_9BACL|nr:flagellar export chaperone FliS [Paenibacillus albus]AZN38520.1 flagellar export chaperone FliS [Paenibacillus albus]
MITTPHQKYQQNSVQTASPNKLIIMLYDGAIRFVKQGIDAIENKTIEQANRNLIKAQNIIHELTAALDFKYPIAKDLARIYEYMLYRLIEANTNKDTAPASEVLNHLLDLKEAWLQASNQVPQSQKSV